MWTIDENVFGCLWEGITEQCMANIHPPRELIFKSAEVFEQLIYFLLITTVFHNFTVTLFAYII